VTYRLYAPEDFDELYAIEEVCFKPPFRFDRRLMKQLVNRPDGATWIAEEDEVMCGFVVIEWTTESNVTLAYLQTLEVLPERRGQRVGNALLNKAEESARAAGAETVWLHVDEKNAGAIKLYEGRGYLWCGREADYYPEGQAALVYEKQLSIDTDG
jgi:[ribosomal protein S18]-alanine N-acetyltransferase